MNKKTVTLSKEQYETIIKTINSGFVFGDGRKVKPNNRIAAALVLEANLGIRISDILQLRLSSIIKDGGRYRLNIIEKKSKLERNFTVPIEIYSFIQGYALENNIHPEAKLFDITERTVQSHLKLVCKYLNYDGISTHSFRKFFASSIYVENNYNIELVRVLLQHSLVVTTQRYLGIQTREIENALRNHVKLV